MVGLFRATIMSSQELHSQLTSIFDNFSKAEDSSGSQGRIHEGAGLGLPLVKRLTALMGGHVVVQSRENEGTTFFVTLDFMLPEG